jgi:hypothetical protein
MLRKSLFFLLTVLLAAIPLTAQTLWMKTYGEGSEEGRCVQQTSDGNYVVVGTTASYGAGQTDIWLLKIDGYGNEIWSKTIGGPDFEWGYCVNQTSDGGYIIAGGKNLSWPGEEDVWLVKTNENGDTAWTKTFGGENYDIACCVQQTSDGGYIVAGFKDGELVEDGYLDSMKVWVIKTDSDGNLTWETSFGEEGDSGEAKWIEETTDGGYIVSLSAYIDGQIWNLMKLDKNGDSLWTARYHLGSSYCVQQTSDGGYVTTGMEKGNVTLVKTNSNGQVEWSKSYGKQNNDCGLFVRQTTDGGYIIAGMWGQKCSGSTCTQGATWLLKADSNGDTVWTRAYGELGAGDYCWCVRETTEEGYILVGYTTTYGTGPINLWLIKTDEHGRIAVEEKPIVNTSTGWEILTAVGQRIVLRYTDCPCGFSAQVFDASGRMVDQIHADEESGTITWGECYGPGVYFIKVSTNQTPRTCKVILVD